MVLHAMDAKRPPPPASEKLPYDGCFSCWDLGEPCPSHSAGGTGGGTSLARSPAAQAAKNAPPPNPARCPTCDGKGWYRRVTGGPCMFEYGHQDGHDGCSPCPECPPAPEPARHGADHFSATGPNVPDRSPNPVARCPECNMPMKGRHDSECDHPACNHRPAPKKRGKKKATKRRGR